MSDQMQTIEQLRAEIDRLQQRVTNLEAEQATYQNVLDALPALIFCKDVQGNVLLVNAAYEGATSMSRNHIVGKNQTDLFPAEIVADWRKIEHNVLTRGTQVDEETFHPQEDGLHTYLSSMIPLQDEQGHTYAFTGIATDITERKKQEETMRSFQSLIEKAPLGISRITLQGEIFFANHAFRAMPGYEQVVGMNIRHLYPESQHPIFDAAMERLTQHGITQDTLIFQRKDGSTFYTNIAAFTIFGNDGQPQEMVAFYQDITEQKQQEAERATLQQQVIDAQQSALRELSTPLIPIADNVVIMPLIGTIDSQRAQMVLEALLEGVAQHQADMAILDITGVQIVDTQVANALIGAARAVRLLGAQVMLTGIQPQIAQTLVHLGVDLGTIITRGSLQAGIAFALNNKPEPGQQL